MEPSCICKFRRSSSTSTQTWYSGRLPSSVVDLEFWIAASGSGLGRGDGGSRYDDDVDDDDDAEEEEEDGDGSCGVHI